MFNLSRCVWASALVFAAVSVNAQEVESSEGMGSEFAMPASAPAQRVAITNDPSDAPRDVRQAEPHR